MNFSICSNLSWFSLSEIIKRKEREKALFSFRLLSHSIKNENFKIQLLADLHFFLDEQDLSLILYKEVFQSYFLTKDINGIFSILSRLKFFNIDLSFFKEKIEDLKNKKEFKNLLNINFSKNQYLIIQKNL